MPTSTAKGRWCWPSGRLPTAASVAGAPLLPMPHLGARRLGLDLDNATQANVQGVRVLAGRVEGPGPDALLSWSRPR